MNDQSHTFAFDLTEYLPFQMSVISAQMFTNVIEDACLQMPEWRIMMALPSHQPCSSHDLCMLTSMDAARVSRAQRRLEDLDLISVIRDNTDRRRLVVRLSDKGTVELSRLKSAAQAAESKMLDALGPEDRAQLKTAIGNLFEQL